MIFKRKKFIHHFSVYFLFYVKKKYEINNSSTYNIIMIIELVLLLLWKNELHWKLHVCYDLASLGQLAGDQKIEVGIVQIIMFWPKPAQFERRNSAAKPLVLDNSLFSLTVLARIEIVAILQRFTHTMKPTAARRCHFALQDVSCKQSWHHLTPSRPRVSPEWHTVQVLTMVYCSEA